MPRLRATLSVVVSVSLVSAALRAQGDVTPPPRERIPDVTPLADPERLPIFFPPDTRGDILFPAGGPIAGSVTRDRVAAPPDLARFVGESFYPPLATRLATSTLSAALRARIDSYYADKVALTAELRDALGLATASECSSNAPELAELARRQSPQLLRLEQQEEQLRRDLIRSEQKWDALRRWRLDSATPEQFSPQEVALVLRGYAFYQDGLSLGQRSLLRELAQDIADGRDVLGQAASGLATSEIALFPSGILLPLPPGLSREAAAAVQAYVAAKTALKRELHDAVLASEGERFASRRTKSFERLARVHAPRLAELDRLCNQARPFLAPAILPSRPSAALGSLPADLKDRVVRLAAARADAIRTTIFAVEEILSAAPASSLEIDYRLDDVGLTFRVKPLLALPARGTNLQKQLAAVADRLNAAANAHQRRNEQHAAEEAAIVEVFAQEGSGQRQSRLPGQALHDAATEQATIGVAEIRTALFLPGLLPAQRRLLLDRALSESSLSLPRGAPQTTARN